jgi:hypothetical protein
MRKIKISIDDETFDSILDQGLKGMYSILKSDYERRKSGTGMAIFETDLEADLEELRKLIKAFKRVMKYCCEPDPKDTGE